MSKFLNYITEAVITADHQSLKNRILSSLSKVPANSRGALFSILGHEFLKDKIYFSLLKNSPETIDGYIDKKTLEIFIEIGRSHVLFTPFPILTDNLVEIISHEFVHREQLERSEGKARFEKLEGEVTRAKVKKYSANVQEIMAYAYQTVLSLRHEGFTDEEIIDMCKNPKKWLDRLENSRTHLDIYLVDYFRDDSSVANRFKKYIVAYLEKK
ncbi:MAG: hypothetical protein WC503_02910 [Candidatus Shapirobacteria bacterium]